jgi:peptide/nickel transport system substrate-binding protein
MKAMIRNRLGIALCAAASLLPASFPVAQDKQSTLTVAVAGFPVEDVIPWLVSGASMAYSGHMYDFVVGSDSQGRISTENGLATSWSTPDSGRTWVFQIRSGVKFHDGSPVTASDAAFSIKQFATPQARSSSAGIFQRGLIDAVARTPAELVVTFKVPVVELPEILSKGGGLSEGAVVPKDYFEKVGQDGFRQKPIGSGPWVFTGRQTGSDIRFKANRAYWRKGAAFDNLVIKAARESSTRAAMLRAGEADIVEIPASVIPTLGANARVQTIPNVAAVGMQLYMAGKVPSAMSDIRVRQALNMAIDRKAINDKIFAGKNQVVSQYPFGPGTAGYDSNLTPYPYDPEKARQLLKDSAVSGLTVNVWAFNIGSLNEGKDIALAVANFWTAVGVKVNVEAMDFGAFRGKYVASPQDFTNAGGDASPFVSSRLASSISIAQIYLVSKAAGGVLQLGAPDQASIDSLYASANTASDPTRRQAFLQQMQRRVHEQYMTVPLLSVGFHYGLSKRVGKWVPIEGGNSAPAYETVTHGS